MFQTAPPLLLFLYAEELNNKAHIPTFSIYLTNNAMPPLPLMSSAVTSTLLILHCFCCVLFHNSSLIGLVVFVFRNHIFNKYYRPLSDFSLPFLDYESLNLGWNNRLKLIGVGNKQRFR